MHEPPMIRILADDQQPQQATHVVTDSELRIAAYRQAMALYDSCVRHAAAAQLQKRRQR
jgi:hypothetical protein